MLWCPTFYTTLAIVSGLLSCLVYFWDGSALVSCLSLNNSFFMDGLLSSRSVGGFFTCSSVIGVESSRVGKASDGGANGLKTASSLKSGWPGLAPLPKWY
ncbi:hypothetical protein Tco_1272808 [Tanacetum coccineum]